MVIFDALVGAVAGAVILLVADLLCRRRAARGGQSS
jgi:hypothetical protein